MENQSIAAVVAARRDAIQARWVEWMTGEGVFRPDVQKKEEVEKFAATFMDQFIEALKSNALDISEAAWDELRGFAGTEAQRRAQRGFTPTETAEMVFSLKRALFQELKSEAAHFDMLLTLNELLDALGLFTVELFIQGKMDIIDRQQKELLELSTPVVQLWRGVVAVPLIGTLDSERTQVVMENLLNSIVKEKAQVAIIDITGVPTVDTLTAQHLMKTVAAARLMGTECVISGIRPAIAQTMVHLGLRMGDVITKGTLAEAFRMAIGRLGLAVTARES